MAVKDWLWQTPVVRLFWINAGYCPSPLDKMVSSKWRSAQRRRASLTCYYVESFAVFFSLSSGYVGWLSREIPILTKLLYSVESRRCRPRHLRQCNSAAKLRLFCVSLQHDEYIVVKANFVTLVKSLIWATSLKFAANMMLAVQAQSYRYLTGQQYSLDVEGQTAVFMPQLPCISLVIQLKMEI